MSAELLRALSPHVVEFDAPLGRRTTYRVGGSVRALVTISRRSELDETLEVLSRCELPVLAVGNGSNLLVNDGRHEIVAVLMTGEFARCDWRDPSDDGGVLVSLGAGVALPVVARQLAGAGVTGFEWAVGVPGSFGGAVAMNAGGHGSDVAHSLVRARVWSRGSMSWRALDQLDMSYRSSALRDGDVVIEGELRLDRGDPETAQHRIREIVRWRRENQPGGQNGGSVFRNPESAPAARLLDAVGAKGTRVGGAVVSEKHANFIQVEAGASARDVYELMRLVAERVRLETGISLDLENRLVGFEGGS